MSNSNRTIGRFERGRGGHERVEDIRETKNDKKGNTKREKGLEQLMMWGEVEKVLVRSDKTWNISHRRVRVRVRTFERFRENKHIRNVNNTGQGARGLKNKKLEYVCTVHNGGFCHTCITKLCLHLTVHY